jgi:hypothetical protein
VVLLAALFRRILSVVVSNANSRSIGFYPAMWCNKRFFGFPIAVALEEC